MEKNEQVSIMRHRTDAGRLIWKVLMAVVVYVAVSFLLRFIPIFLITAFQASRGIDRQDALEAAKALVFEHPIWSIALGIINAFASVLLVWFLITAIEKRHFAWKDVGLDWRRNSFVSLAFGALLALLMYVVEAIVDHQVLNSSIPSIDTFMAALTISAVIRNLALWIPMGFSEEVLFRGYIQTRLVERHGTIWGILTGSIVFTLLHILFRPISPVTIFSAVILWAAVGVLYHQSRSLYLVGMFHAIANSLLNVFPSDRSNVAGLIVHILALVLIVIVGLCTSRSSGDPPGPAVVNPRGATEGDGP